MTPEIETPVEKRELKISEDKILKILPCQTQIDKNDEIRIIHFSGYQKFEDILKDFSSLNSDNFPKAFVIQIDIEDTKGDTTFLKEFFLEQKSSKIKLIQIKSKNLKNYLRNNSNGKYDHVFILPGKKNSIENLKRLKFDIKTLLAIQNKFLSDLNFCDFLDFEGIITTELNLVRFAINAQDEVCYQILKLFNLEISQKDQNEILISIITSGNYEIFVVFFDVFKDSEINVRNIEKILNLNDFEGKNENVILLSVRNRNLKVLKFLLNFYEIFKNSFKFECIEKAFDLCNELGFFDIFEELKNFDFKEKEKFTKIIEIGEENLKHVEKFHEDIENGKLEEIKIFSNRFPKCRLCITPKYPKSALEHAVESRKLEIYAFLRANFYYTKDKVELDLNEKLNYEEQLKVKEFNLKYMKTDPNSFIGVLSNKVEYDAVSKVDPDNIRDMITKLSQRKELKSIFVNASSTDVRIFFTFDAETIDSMDPTRNNKTFGMAYHEKGEIYVGRDATDFDRYGTFTHELMHYLYYKIYENDCLPYCKNDKDREKLWAEIRNETNQTRVKNQREVDLIIHFAFMSYPRIDTQLIELAVRVPHLYAKYHKNVEKLNKMRILFPKLFDFFEKLILPDFEIPNVCRIIKINIDFGLLKEILESRFKAGEITKINLENFEEHQKIILSSNFTQLTLSSLVVEIDKKYVNKLHLKVKNIFITFEKLKQDPLNELEDLIKKSDVERIIVEIKDIEVEKFKLLEIIGKKVQIILVMNQKENEIKVEGYKNFEIRHEWNDLTEESMKAILDIDIEYQKRIVKVSKIFDANTSSLHKIFHILCKEQNIRINSNFDFEFFDNFFVSRELQKKNKINQGIFELPNLNYQDFLKEIKDEAILLLSDNAGSGKTIILKKIYQDFLEKFPEHWITLITLKDYLKALENETLENFEDFLIKILKLDQVETEVFRLKFSNCEVKILFDAFDEISPVCYEKMLEVFKKFKLKLDESNFASFSQKNQILITSRTNLETDLERELNPTIYQLKPFEKEQQIQVLINCWEKSNDVSYDHKLFFAEKLVEKLSKLISSINGVIGVPLIIKNLAKIYETKINEHFEKEIENLRISEIFNEAVMKANLQTLKKKFPNKCIDIVDKSENFLGVLEYLAIVHLFGEPTADELQIYYNDDDWIPEDITRGGIIKVYNLQTKEIKFGHEAFAEFLVSKYAHKFMKNLKKVSEHQINFLLEILIDHKYLISRIFLNDMLENFKESNLKILYSANKIQEILNDPTDEYFFKLFSLGEEVLSNLVKLIFNFLKTNSELLNKYIQFGYFLQGNNILMELLPQVKNENTLKYFLDEIFNFYGQNVFENFLSGVNMFGNTILHLLCTQKRESFWEYFGEKILFESKKDLKTRDAMKAFLLFKNQDKINALLFSIGTVSFCGMFKNIFSRNLKLEEFIQESDNNDKNFLHYLGESGSETIINFVLQSLKNDLDEENFIKFILANSSDHETFLSLAIKKGLKMNEIFGKLKELVKDDDKFWFIVFSKSNEGMNAFHLSIKWQNYSSFCYLFHKLCTRYENVQTFLQKTRWKGLNFLQLIAKHSSLPIFNIAYETLDNNLNQLKEFLKVKTNHGLNILHLLIMNENINFVKYFFDIVQSKFTNDELKEVLIEKDENNFVPLHYAAKHYEPDVFQYFLSVYEVNLENSQIQEILKVNNLRDGKDPHFDKNILNVICMNRKNNKYANIFNVVEEALEKYEIKVKGLESKQKICKKSKRI